MIQLHKMVRNAWIAVMLLGLVQCKRAADHAPPPAAQSLRPVLVGREALVEMDADVTRTVPALIERPIGAQVRLRRYTLPLNNPSVVAARDADFMRPDDDVVGVLLDGEARAYPWWLIRGYHTANDFLDGRPIFLAFCEACAAGSVFYPIVGQQLLDFGYADDRDGTWEMFDFQTHSRWHSLAGLAYTGALAGVRLNRVPTYQTTWAEWLRAQPGTSVAVGSPELRERPHGKAAYLGDAATSQWFEATLHTFDKRLWDHDLTYAFVPRAGGIPRAYPLLALRAAHGVLQDTFDGDPIVLVLQGTTRVSAYKRQLGSKLLDFVASGDPEAPLRDSAGGTWNEWGKAVSGPYQGRSLEFAGGYLTKWYTWINTFPESQVGIVPAGQVPPARTCGAPGPASRHLTVAIGGRGVEFASGSFATSGEAPFRATLRSADGEWELGVIVRAHFENDCPASFALPTPANAPVVLYLSPRAGPEALYASDNKQARGRLTLESYRFEQDRYQLAFRCEKCVLPARRGTGAVEIDGAAADIVTRPPPL